VAIRKGEQWHCSNQACNGEILVITSSESEAGVNPRCSCGSTMKKPYSRPAVKAYPATAEAWQRLEMSESMPPARFRYGRESNHKN
jgi:hypothetical protein